MTDRRTGKVIILDVGEVYQRRLHDDVEQLPKLERDLEVLRGVAIDFGLSGNERQIQTAFREGGLGAVRSLLMKLTQK